MNTVPANLKKLQPYLKEYSFIIMLCLSIGIFLMVIFLRALPMWQRHELLNREREGYDKQSRILERYIKEHRDYDFEYAVTKEQYKKLKEESSFGSEESSNIEGLQRLVQGTGVTLTLAKLAEKPKMVNGMKVVRLEVKASGEYAAIINFLELLDKSPFMTVEALSLEADNSTLIRALGVMRLYSYGQV